MTTKTELARRQEHLDALAVLGGKLTGEDDITFAGTKFVIPEHLGLAEAVTFLEARRDDDENEVTITRTFPYRPYDGARATGNAIREAFGFTMGKTLITFFGKELPQLVDVATGPGDEDREQVPWGLMRLPGLRGAVINLGATRDAELGSIFHVTAECPRKYRFHIEGLFKLIMRHLKKDSLYRGKAIDGAMNFIDVTAVDSRDVVFTHSVQRRLECDVWSFLRHRELLDTLGQGGKFAALFEGDYGTGKSLAALITAQIAVECGWTFIMCRPGQDELVTVLELGRMYQPAVIFGEDVDATSGPQARTTIERNLDVIDGIRAKGLNMLTVFTTNHAEEIHKGMLRPGRIGAVIRFGAMDRDGVERLTRRIVGDALDPDTDFDEVFNHLEGYMPAFVREVLDRSVRYAITLNDGVLGQIGTEALCLAADGLRDQYDLMQGAKEERSTVDLATALSGVVQKAVTGVDVQDYGGDSHYQLVATGNGQ